MGTRVDSIRVDNTPIQKDSIIPYKNNASDPSIFSNKITAEEKKLLLEQEEERKAKRRKILIGVGVAVTIGITIGAVLLAKKGVSNAKIAKTVPMDTIPNKEGDIVKNILNKTPKETVQSVQNIVEDEGFLKQAGKYAQSRIKENPNIVKTLAESDNLTDGLKSSIELTGTGPTKLAQILSNDTKTMAQIEEKMPELAKAIRKTRSDCNPGRTLEEAAAFVDEAFKGKGYRVSRQLGAGSIGATYLAETADGKEVVIKMIKKGISIDSLKAEEELMCKTVAKLCKTQEETSKLQETVRSLYKGWIEELDMAQELRYNQLLSNGSSRYSVARITDIADNGHCLVMEMAEGLQMNKLMTILKDYKANPAEFATKYADAIKKYPWLADPESVISELPTSIMKAFDEQLLFLGKNGTTIMHGDPHSGNFFITTNRDGKLIPQFVDTDNCVIRSSREIQDDIRMFSNYFVGNSEEVAKYFVNMCGVNAQENTQLTKTIAQELEKHIFGKRCNITSFSKFQENIQAILSNHGLSLSTKNSTAMKAQLQFFNAVREASELSGKKFDILTLLKDIPHAVFDMVKAGENPLNSIKGALIFIAKNPIRALGNIGQFFV